MPQTKRVLCAIELILEGDDQVPAEPGQMLRLRVPADLAAKGTVFDVLVRVEVQAQLEA